MRKVHVGLDLGGTKLLALVTDSRRKILASKKVLLDWNLPQDDFVEAVAEVYFDLIEPFGDVEVAGVGVAMAGPVDPIRGVVIIMPNVGLEQLPLADLLRERIDVPVALDNDVNLATLAEFHLGAGRGEQNVYAFYPGTGLGGGYICHGKLVRGKNFTAGEVGHMVVKIDGELCGCGRRGCLETIVSQRGFVRRLSAALAAGRTSMLQGLPRFHSDDLARAWQAGDAVVKEILTEQAQALGIGIANVINLIGVDCIIIGGNVYHKLSKELLPLVIETAELYAIGGGMCGVKVRLNALGAEAPALGATFL